MTPRTCLPLLSANLLVLVAPGVLLGQEATITHGPILGRPGTRSMGVWVRTSRPAEFRVHFESGGKKGNSAAGRTTLDRDNTGWVLLEGLQPETKYVYQVVVEGQKTGPGGTFRTLPDAAAYRDPKLNPRGLFNFSFEFACGNNQTPGQGAGPALPAFKTMLAKLKDRIDFAVLNGDWLYEDRRDHAPAAWAKQVGIDLKKAPAVVRDAPTIVGVWENYKVYLERGKNLAAWHRHVPSYFTFDDHEILNDVWGAGTTGLRDRRAVFRDIGVQAWYDYLGWSNPIPFTQGIHFGRGTVKGNGDVLTDPEADFTKLDLKQLSNLHVHWGTDTAGVNDNALDDVGGDPNAGVYDIVEVLGKHQVRIRPAAKKDGAVAYSIGRRSYWRKRMGNCDFFFLDTRSHRDMHDVKVPDKKITMLGKHQLEWLKKEMKASDADFFFLFSSVNLMVPHVGGGKVRATNKDDAWTVFLHEREQLIPFWDGLGKRVFLLTGDLHNSFVIKITDRVWEFASGPHNSNNHWYTDEGDRPAAGFFKWGPRGCHIRWSTWFRNDIPREALLHPTYCVVQVNNVFDNPLKLGEHRWTAFERPQVVFQYYDGRTGALRYAEALPAVERRGKEE